MGGRAICTCYWFISNHGLIKYIESIKRGDAIDLDYIDMYCWQRNECDIYRTTKHTLFHR